MSTVTRRILIVDDNQDTADCMAIILRLAGHEVRTAYDGLAALALARLQPPEVVISDISMPGMCGLELARHLRQDLDLRDSFLVALSGYGLEEDRDRSRGAGFNAHFTKPVHLDELKALLTSDDFFNSGSPAMHVNPVSDTMTSIAGPIGRGIPQNAGHHESSMHRCGSSRTKQLT